VVRIRLRRMGAKKKPFYRIVVSDQRNARDGRFIETIGTYNPLTEPPTIELKADRAAHWLSHGAQASDAVAQLLKRQGITDKAGKVIYQATEAAPVTAAETAPETVA
jgi:small subunit ribosomal protein S16